MLTDLEKVFRNLAQYSWKEWVYIERTDVRDSKTKCLVLNPDNAELGSDDFTPEPVERLDMVEFLSVQDLVSVKENLLRNRPGATIFDMCDAAVFYFENDAFV
ncbi:DUF7716 domain-containing protein [Ochrobactrum sp. BTU1]|uniref:DUF7716 domain-containing protein n=1 Tax=Ochrobactrum sp. BTU1 TaxID=2840456 RepID=UPI001C04EE22|nr:hypothetical protein KMS41_26160 [Ochrobactrum sp. BTU1]